MSFKQRQRELQKALSDSAQRSLECLVAPPLCFTAPSCGPGGSTGKSTEPGESVRFTFYRENGKRSAVQVKDMQFRVGSHGILVAGAARESLKLGGFTDYTFMVNIPPEDLINGMELVIVSGAAYQEARDRLLSFKGELRAALKALEEIKERLLDQ